MAAFGSYIFIVTRTDEKAEQIQRAQRREGLEELSLDGTEEFPVLVRVRARHGDVHRTDRLGLGAAARTGDAGDAHAVRRAEALADAAGEGDGDLLRDLALSGPFRDI